MKEQSDQEGIDFDLPDNDPAINERLKSDPEFRREFAEHWLLVAALEETLGQKESNDQTPSLDAASGVSNSRPNRRADVILRYGGWLVAALVILGLFVFGADLREEAETGSQVSFTSLARASFFGELTPAIGSTADLKRDYSLVAGSVELSFPDGATTIVEAPAVFRVEANDWLALDVGSCSVHAPPGAEGFRVDTPNSRVIDRGTRFVVNVSEFSETEVQVVEGAADIYPESEEAEKVHLTDGSGRRVGNKGLVPVNFSADSYRRQVPDRIISFEATRGADGKARELSQVTVQRDGLIREYRAGDLIPIELVSFTPDSSSPSLNVFGDKDLPERRASLIEDLLLNGGIINPGGSARPLQQEFDYRTTPGFAIRFARPVRNGPGPDVVFFEVQNPMNPSDGDAFHVGPLEWEPGKRFHTVRRYDLMMTSAEALLITERYIHYADHQIRSPEDLETASYSAKISPLNTRAIAVGIDLSDLGYEEGESASGLFFQDAKDDDNHVDPIVIRGLPH